MCGPTHSAFSMMMEEPWRFDEDEVRGFLTPEGSHKAFEEILKSALQPGNPLKLKEVTLHVEPSLTSLAPKEPNNVSLLLEGDCDTKDTPENRRKKRKLIPTGVTEESMNRLVHQYVTSASIESQRQWMGAQLRDRASACAPNFQSPFKNLRDAWNALHVYHVFHQPSPKELELADFEHQVRSTLGEFEKWVEHAEAFYSKTLEKQDKAFPTEEEVLLGRLSTALENEKVQGLRAEMMSVEAEIKHMLNPDGDEDDVGDDDDEDDEDAEDEASDEDDISDYDD